VDCQEEKKSGVEHQIKRDKLSQNHLSSKKYPRSQRNVKGSLPYTGNGANYNSELINKGRFEVNKNQIGLN
jgi:hypothetical protein